MFLFYLQKDRTETSNFQSSSFNSQLNSLALQSLFIEGKVYKHYKHKKIWKI